MQWRTCSFGCYLEVDVQQVGERTEQQIQRVSQIHMSVFRDLSKYEQERASTKMMLDEKVPTDSSTFCFWCGVFFLCFLATTTDGDSEDSWAAEEKHDWPPGPFLSN